MDICHHTEWFSNMVNTRWKHVKWFSCKKKLFNKNQLEAHYQHYHPISLNEGLLPNGILPPASWDHPEPSWFDYSRCTWMAIDKQPINVLPVDTILGAPPPQDTPNEEPIDPQQPDLTCTPDPTKTKVHRQVVGVENGREKVYGKATELYNKHRKYSEQCNPCHPFRSAHDFQQAQSFGQQTKTWIDQHLRRGLDNFEIESFQSADALRKFFSERDFGLCHDSGIEYHSHIFGTLYNRDISKCIQFLIADLPFRAHLNFEPVRLTDSEGRATYSEMNTGNCGWDLQDQLAAGATIVPVICTSDITHLTNISGDQHATPLYLTIRIIRKVIWRIRNELTWIHIGLHPMSTERGQKHWQTMA